MEKIVFSCLTDRITMSPYNPTFESEITHTKILWIFHRYTATFRYGDIGKVTDSLTFPTRALATAWLDQMKSSLCYMNACKETGVPIS